MPTSAPVWLVVACCATFVSAASLPASRTLSLGLDTGILVPRVVSNAVVTTLCPAGQRAVAGVCRRPASDVPPPAPRLPPNVLSVLPVGRPTDVLPGRPALRPIPVGARADGVGAATDGVGARADGPAATLSPSDAAFLSGLLDDFAVPSEPPRPSDDSAFIASLCDEPGCRVEEPGSRGSPDHTDSGESSEGAGSSEPSGGTGPTEPPEGTGVGWLPGVLGGVAAVLLVSVAACVLVRRRAARRLVTV